MSSTTFYKLCLISCFTIIYLFTATYYLPNYITKRRNINENIDLFLTIKKHPSDNTCKFLNRIPFIFSYVFVRADGFLKRKTLRETWANSEEFPNFRKIFVLGLSKNETVNENIQEENEKYNDILQGNFIDSSRNLSYKSLIAWKWILYHSQNCLDASFILKIDDDVVLNTHSLLNFINSNTSIKRSIYSFFCNYNPEKTPVCRNKTTCNPLIYTSFEEYNENLYGINDYYSSFCSGTAFLMTPDLIRPLYLKSNKIKVFWIDDVFVGIIARYLSKSAKFVQFSHLYETPRYLKKDLRILLKEKDVWYIQDVWQLSDIIKTWNILEKIHESKKKFSSNNKTF